MLFNKKSEIDDLFDFNGVKMKTFTQWNRLRHGPMERTEIMKNVTLKDVAKAAGVSYATVSRALSGSNQIGKSTRERIVRLCDEMGYTGNYVARSMVMKKTYLLGLVVPAIENEFMSQLAYYVEMSARARGYNIMLCNSEPDLKQEEMVVKLLLGRRVDGILIVPQSPATYEKIAPLLEQIPAVFLSENLRDQPQSYVSVDNSRGAYLGVEYLYGLGHREILYFGCRNSTTHQLRAEGYLRACRQFGLEPRLHHSDFARSSIENGYRRPTAKRRIAKDRSGSVDSYRQISRIFFFTVIPVIVSSGVYNINSVIDNGIMAHGMESLGRGKEFLALWGIYNNKYMLLVHVPLAMANSLSSSLIPSLSGAIARKDRKAAIEKTALAIRFAMLIAIPSAVGLTVLSAPVNNLLFRGGNNAEAIRMMMIGASAVIFLSLSTVTNAILQGLNRMNVPVRNALISLALHVIALYIMLMIFNMGIYSMVFASILFALFMCILNAIAIHNTLGYRQEMVKTFLLPAISAAFMGAAAYGVYRGVTLVIHSNVLGTLLAVLVAVAVYGVLLIKLHCIEEDEMYSMPMGRKLTRICRKLHLM